MPGQFSPATPAGVRARTSVHSHHPIAVARTDENASVHANSRFQRTGGVFHVHARTASAPKPTRELPRGEEQRIGAATGHFFDSTAVNAHTAPADTASRLPFRLVSSQGATMSGEAREGERHAIHLRALHCARR
jgi:hypothetical protein